MNMYLPHRLYLILPLLLGSLLASPRADGQIRITKPAGEKITVQLAGLTTTGDGAARVFAQTLRSNLERSGWFRVVGAGQAEVAISGSAQVRGGQLVVECRVLGTANRQQFIAQRYQHAADEARRLAHRVADDIVKAVTGYEGIASTRIVMVGVQENAKELFLCDADGEGLTQLTSDRSIAVRPRWGGSRRLTYTAYLQRFPDVFLIDLETGDRNAVANYSGLNAGGVLSPNGEDLAVILSKDGNPDLYVKNLRTGRVTRLTQTPGANEASPAWSPDGRQMVYVSDQAGRPHLYIISRDGGAPRRMTSRGRENVAPDWGPNGLIAYASREGGQYQIVVADPQGNEVHRFVDPQGAHYEDPSWAPNGRHLVCARKENYRSQIYILDIAGDRPIRLTPSRGDWFSPAWSPLQ
jgi:TolB protein